MLAALLACAGGGASARQDTIEGLTRAVGDRVLPSWRVEQRYGALVDCASVPVADLDALSVSAHGALQWINDAAYSWRHVPFRGGQCIYIVQPDARGLTRDEARVFLSAHELPFPVENPRTHETTRCEDAASAPAVMQAMPTLDGTGSREDIPINDPAAGLSACDLEYFERGRQGE